MERDNSSKKSNKKLSDYLRVYTVLLFLAFVLSFAALIAQYLYTRSVGEMENGMLGVANLLRIVAPLYLMCSPQDVCVVYQVKSPITDKPTLIIYDNYPGGVGLAQKAYSMQRLLLEKCLEIVTGCTCSQGCPSCVGPIGEVGLDGKETAIRILRDMLLRSDH